MFGATWEPAAIELLKSCRKTSGLSEQDFARAHSVSVPQLRELEGKGARHFYTEDIKARAGLRILAKYGHQKYMSPLVVQDGIRPDLKRVRPNQEQVEEVRQRNRRDVTMLGSCAALVMGVFVMLPQIEGGPDAQLAINRQSGTPPVLADVANPADRARSAPLPSIEIQQAQTLNPDRLPATAAGQAAVGATSAAKPASASALASPSTVASNADAGNKAGNMTSSSRDFGADIKSGKPQSLVKPTLAAKSSSGKGVDGGDGAATPADSGADQDAQADGRAGTAPAVMSRP